LHDVLVVADGPHDANLLSHHLQGTGVFCLQLADTCTAGQRTNHTWATTCIDSSC
jgi:hypothetical protein